MDDKQLKKLLKKVIEGIYNDYLDFKEKHKTILLFKNEAGLQCEIYHRLISDKEFNQTYHIYPEQGIDAGGRRDIVIFEPKNAWYHISGEGTLGESGIKKASVIIELKGGRRAYDWYRAEIKREIESLKKESCPIKILIVFDPKNQFSEKLIKEFFNGTGILYAYFDLVNKKKMMNF